MECNEQPKCEESCCVKPCCEPVSVHDLAAWATQAKCFLIKYGAILPAAALVLLGLVKGIEFSLIGLAFLVVGCKLCKIEKKMENCGPWY